MKDIRLDPARDARMSGAIRAATGDTPLEREALRALHERIMGAARPQLSQHRNARPSWIDYAAAWSRTIIPIGVATALVAASCLVWLSVNAPKSPAGTVEHVAMLGAATNAVSSGDLIDLAISDVDMPAPPAPDRAQRARIR